MQFYMIHDNMARPFKVCITDDKIKVYEHKPYDGKDSDFDEDDIEQYNVPVMSIKNYIQVFVGEDPEIDDYKGNNILIHTEKNKDENKYIMIEGEIFEFSIKDKINEFYSPVGNSDVPYSYAIGKKYTYLMCFKNKIPTKVLEKNSDPYENKYDKFYESFSTKTLVEREI